MLDARYEDEDPNSSKEDGMFPVLGEFDECSRLGANNINISFSTLTPIVAAIRREKVKNYRKHLKFTKVVVGVFTDRVWLPCTLA